MRLFRQPRELIVIRNPLNPTASDVEQYTGHDLEALIKQAFPQGLTESVKFYHGSLLKEVPREIKQDIDKLLSLEGRIYAVIKPMGAEVWVPILVSIVVSVAVALLMPMPTMNQAAPPISPNNSLAQRTNRQRLGGRIPDIYGTVWSVPDLIAPTYSVYIDHIETEFSFLSVGRGYFDIKEARDDTTPVEQILGTTVDVFNPNVSVYRTPIKRFGGSYNSAEDKFSKLAVKRYTSVNGQVLSPPDNIFSSDNMSARPNGVITATDTNFTGQFSVGDTVQISDADKLASANNLQDESGNAVTYNLNGSFTVTAVSNSSLTLDVSGSVEWVKLTSNSDFTTSKFNINTNSNSLWQGWFYASSGEDFTDLMLNIVAPNGIYTSGQDGNWQSAHIEYLVQMQVLDKDNNVLSESNTTSIISSRLASKYGGSWTYDDEVRRSAGQTIMIPVPVRQNATDKVRFRIRRTTNKIKKGRNTTIQEIRIKDFFSCRYMYGYEQSYNTTTVYAKQRATEGALSVKERKLRLLVERFVRNWQDNNALILSNRADDILYDIATDSKLGNLTPSQINMPQIKAEVDAINENFGTPLASEFCYTFDDNKVSAEEMLQTVAKAVFSQAYRFNNQINLLFERKLPASVAIFNSHNILPDTFEKSESFGVHNDNDGVSVEYIDPVDDAQMTINTSEGLSNAKKETLVGVRNKMQAWFHMMRMWNKLQYSYKSCEFTGGDESGIVVRSNRITVADQSRADIQQGEVVDIITVGNDIVLQTSNPVELTTQSNTLFIQTVNNGVEAIPCFANDDYSVKLARLPSGVISLGYGNVVTATYQIVKDNDKERDSYLVTEKTPSDGLTNKLTCINYTDKYYQNDSDYRNNLIP